MTEPTDQHREQAREDVDAVAQEIGRFISSTTPLAVGHPMIEAFKTIIYETCFRAHCSTTISHLDYRKAVRSILWDWAGAEHLSLPLLDELVERVALALSSRDAEIRAVLEGLSVEVHGHTTFRCWCWQDRDAVEHSAACLAARALWARVQP